jgi:hypothetical protein
LIGQNPNWTKGLGTVAATINSQHGRGKHDTSAFEAMYGQKYHHPMLCSKEEAHKCWTLPDLLGVTNNEGFALYIAQHFYVGDDDYASTTNAEDNEESGYFSEDELSKSDEQEVTDEFSYAHLFDYLPKKNDESKFLFSTPEKVTAQSLLKMPTSFQSSDKKRSNHSVYHSEDKGQPGEADVTYSALSRMFIWR